ncbi:hypothetical protein MPER_01141, partial [Moniliophthora perniciosa FA553]
MNPPISPRPNSPRGDLFAHIYSRYDNSDNTAKIASGAALQDATLDKSTIKLSAPVALEETASDQTLRPPVDDPTLLRHVYEAVRRVPEAEDWPLFRVACKKGQEAAAVHTIAVAASKLLIRSAYTNAPGWVYLEAVSMRSPALNDFLHLVPGIIFQGKTADSPPKWFQVPREDWGSWVRIRRGNLYKGDVGLVIEENPGNTMLIRQVRVLLIPRLHTPYALGKQDISKLLAAQKPGRPAQALLPPGFFGGVLKHYKWRCRLASPCSDEERGCTHRQYKWQSQTFDAKLIVRGISS